MKKIICLLSLTSFFCVSLRAQTATADSLIHKAFASLKNNEEQSFVALFPTYPQIRRIFDGMVAGIKDTAMRAKMKMQLDKVDEAAYNKDLKPEFGNAFRSFQEQAKAKGMNWLTARLDSFPAHEEESPGMDIKYLNGKMYVSSGNAAYVIPFSNVVYADGGWYGIQLNGIESAGKKD